MIEGQTPVPVASYGGLGAWAAAEIDAALLQSAGIPAVVSGDAHHSAPLFGGHQVTLQVVPSDRDDAVLLLTEQDGGYGERQVAPPA